MKVTQLILNDRGTIYFRDGGAAEAERVSLVNGRSDGLRITFPLGARLELPNAVDVSEQIDEPRIHYVVARHIDKIFIFGGKVAYWIDQKANLVNELPTHRTLGDEKYWSITPLLWREGEAIFVYEGGVLAIDKNLELRWHIRKNYSDLLGETSRDWITLVRNQEECYDLSLKTGAISNPMPYGGPIFPMQKIKASNSWRQSRVIKVTQLILDDRGTIYFRDGKFAQAERFSSIGSHSNSLRIVFPTGAKLELPRAVDVSELLDESRIHYAIGDRPEVIFIFGGETAYWIDVNGSLASELSIFRTIGDEEYWETTVLRMEDKAIFVYEGGVLAIDTDLKVLWHIKKFYNDVLGESTQDWIRLVRDHDQYYDVDLVSGAITELKPHEE